MAGKQRPPQSLGSLETLVMYALWRDGPSTVHDVLQALDDGKRRAYTTVLTTLRNLERKGMVAHDAVEAKHLFRAVIAERTVAHRALSALCDRLFDGSRIRLVEALLAEDDLQKEEFEALRMQVLELKEREQEEQKRRQSRG